MHTHITTRPYQCASRLVYHHTYRYTTYIHLHTERAKGRRWMAWTVCMAGRTMSFSALFVIFKKKSHRKSHNPAFPVPGYRLTEGSGQEHEDLHSPFLLISEKLLSAHSRSDQFSGNNRALQC